ncbi:MAG TPA: hypothetical protein VJC08_05550 [bacterium]|nr:hypothetical protein [bacterium]
MRKKCPETVIGFILLMMVILPFCALAVENDESSMEYPKSSGIIDDAGMPSGKKDGEHVASGVSSGNLGNFRNRANRRLDNLVSKYEASQAKKDPEDGSFADRAVHSQAITSKGESIGKPAWMDNNPLKPATDSESEVKTPPAQEVEPAAQTQAIAPGTGDGPPAEPAR